MLSTSAKSCLTNSRNLGPTFCPALYINIPDVFRLEVLDGGVDVVDLDADVVDAARRVLLEEAGDGRLVPERMQQLDLKRIDSLYIRANWWENCEGNF